MVFIGFSFSYYPVPKIKINKVNSQLKRNQIQILSSNMGLKQSLLKNHDYELISFKEIFYK